MKMALKPSEAAIMLWGTPFDESKRKRIYRWIKRGILGNVFRDGRRIWIPTKNVEQIVGRIEEFPPDDKIPF